MNDRQICTPDNPMPPNSPGRWAHTTVIETGENYTGDVAYYRCIDCGQEWEEELAQ